MQIINNTNGLFEDIHFKNDIITQSIKNHKELLKEIIPKCSKVLIVSPFLMDNFEHFFKSINIQNVEFELITTCKSKESEQAIKPFQIKNFGLTIKKFTKKYPSIHLINILHSKIYLFYEDTSIVLGIVTSANFTNNGLSENHETGVILLDNKILVKLEKDIKKNLEYINLSELQIDNLCKEAEKLKKDKLSQKKEEINIDLSKYFDKNTTLSIENKNSNDNLNNSEVFLEENEKFDFANFISEQIINNSQINILNLSNLKINTIPININQLTELKNINISDNNISILPDELFSLKKLENLDISNNKIKLIPDSIKDTARSYPKVFHKLIMHKNEDIKIHIDITWIKSFKTIIVDKLIINKTLQIFTIFKNSNVQILDENNNNLDKYIEYLNNEVINDKTDTLYNQYNQNIIKTCSRCYKELGLDKFYNSEKSSGKNGLYSYCKECNSKEGHEKERQPKQILRNLFRKKLVIQASKNNSDISYTKEDFVEFLEKQPHFKKVYEEYKNNEYDSDLKPNFYLIDKNKDYSLDNIQICTSKEANKKYKKSLENIGGEPTVQFSLGNEPINLFESAQEAKRTMNLSGDSIINCCNGKFNTAANNKWKYLKDIKDSTTLEKIEKIKKISNCYVDDEEFLLDFVDNKDLEDYLKIIIYFRNYESLEIQEIIQDTILSNTNGFLLDIFKNDVSKFEDELINNYSKIEIEYFDYLYGFTNIRYSENEDIPILGILKIIAKNTKTKQLIEFLMENRTKEEIFIEIIQNDTIKMDIEFIEKRIIKYYLHSDFIDLAMAILQNENLNTSVIKKIIAKVDENQIKDILLSVTYHKSSTNKWIIEKFGDNSKDVVNIERAKKIHNNFKENDEILKKSLLEFRNSNINKDYVIDEKCILSNSMIEQLILKKPINLEEFKEKIPLKLRENIKLDQMKFLNNIFELIEMSEE